MSSCSFMGITLLGTILRVIFIIKDIGGLTMFTSCLIFYLISVCFRAVIFGIGSKIGRFDLQHHKKLTIASTVFHIVITLATFTGYMTTIREHPDFNRIVALVWNQVQLAVISGISTTEFLVVLTGGFRSRSLECDSNLIRELNTEETDSDPIIECKICLMEFSASRIPRILINCGHTICEHCADRVIRNGRIACPTCQTVTVVDGNASKLTKNHAVLEFVEGIKME